MTFEITREQFEATVQQYMAYLFPDEDPGYLEEDPGHCGFCERKYELGVGCEECPAFNECWYGVYVRWMRLEYRVDAAWESEQCLLEILELLHGYGKEREWVK